MTSINFVLLREGSSDDGLIGVLRLLLLDQGATSVIGTARSYVGGAEYKLSQVLAEEPMPSLIFFFRDTDSTTYDHRYDEIMRPAQQLDLGDACVPVIAIQELEAWLLLDESAIRHVAGKPSGKLDLGLPTVQSVESLSSPKEILREVLLAASEKSGRRRDREKRKFAINRAALLQRLDHRGPVRGLSAWQKLEGEVARGLNALAS